MTRRSRVSATMSVTAPLACAMTARSSACTTRTVSPSASGWKRVPGVMSNTLSPSNPSEAVARVAADLLADRRVHRERQLEIARGVGVDGQELDLRDGAGELAATMTERLRAVRRGHRAGTRWLVALGEQAGGLAELVDQDLEHGDGDGDDEADAQLIPGDAR